MRHLSPSPLSVIGIVALAGLTCALISRHLLGLSGAAHDIALGLLTGVTAWVLLKAWGGRWRTASAREAEAVDKRNRVELRRATESQAARMQAIVATATEGIITIDQAGAIETFNGAAERLFGYRADEVVGRNVKLLMPMPYHGEHDGYLERYVRTGEARIIGIGREVEGLRRDGTTFPIDLSVGEGRADGVRFFTAVVRDITFRKDIQAKLTQAERLAAVGELAAGVAHEVNNPINTVINCAQLIKDGDEAGSNCDVIIAEGERIAAIVKDLLQFARDDRDRPQPTALPDVVARTMRLIGESFQRHGIAVEVAVPDDLPPVHARPQQVQQVLLNLLINAKDALQAAGGPQRLVRITGEPEGAGAVLAVRDNGPGVPAALGNRVFEPFVTTKRARGGTGLGLSISKGIVEGYGGRIEVRSEAGQGAEFRVWLPFTTNGKE